MPAEPPHPYCTEHDQPLDWCHHDSRPLVSPGLPLSAAAPIIHAAAGYEPEATAQLAAKPGALADVLLEMSRRAALAAAPAVRAEAAAAEHARIRLALLGCRDCGKAHQPRVAVSQPPGGKPFAHQDWADPDDGHAYRPRWRTAGVDLAELIGDQP
jgi:hypothetical protein